MTVIGPDEKMRPRGVRRFPLRRDRQAGSGAKVAAPMYDETQAAGKHRPGLLNPQEEFAMSMISQQPAAPTEVVLFDGQRVRFANGWWQWLCGDEWIAVVPGSVLARAIESDEDAQAAAPDGDWVAEGR